MKNKSNFSSGSKLINPLQIGQFVGLNFGLVLIIALLIGLAGQVAYRVTKQQNEVILTRNRVERLTQSLQILTLERLDLLRRYLESTNVRQRLLYQSKQAEFVTAYNELAALLRNPAEAQALQAVLAAEDAFNEVVQETFALYDSGAAEEAGAYWDREGPALQSNMVAAIENWSQIQAENSEVIIEEARRAETLAVRGVIIFTSLVLVGGVFASYIVTRSIAKPISSLVDKTKTIDFDLTTRVRPAGPQEIAFLGKSINQMADRLLESKRDLQQSKDRLEQELISASRTQASLFPKAEPDLPGAKVACFWQPARELAGDFYTHRRLGPHKLGLVLGDVVGKGAAAAMTASLTLGLMESYFAHCPTPERFLQSLNRSLLQQFYAQHMAVACCYAILDQQANKLHLANAGCMFPYLIRDGHIQEIEVFGLPLGVWPEYDYISQVITLQPGDLVIFSSDGFTEARNRDNAIFGFDRFEEELQRLRAGATAQAVIEQLVEALQSFIGNVELSDDVTLVVLQITDRVNT